jgi:hypothetical protein
MTRLLRRPAFTSPILALLLVAPVAAQVSGFVLDSATLTPVADALVTLQASPHRTTTAADGSFTLPVVGASITVVAAKKGYFNSGVVTTAPASGVQIVMDPVHVGHNLNYQVADPQACAVCHPDQYSQWVGSPMSGAGTNTWIYDIYDGSGSAGGMGGFVYLRDSVFRQTHPNSECASCHQPEPWVKQPFGALEPIGSLSVGAMHGVSCDICHKVADVDERRMNYPGIYPGYVDFNLPNAPLALHQVMYGVLGDVNYRFGGQMRASYQPQLVAEVCGACHQDKNDPDGDGNFEEANGVVSEPTYHEWLASPYGDPRSPTYQTCVDCHMPAFGATQVCNVLPLQRDTNSIRSHRIEGTTPAFLEQAVELRLQVRETPVGLAVIVEVDNRHTGHHVPTGVTIRNMVLVVEAWQVASGQRLALAAGPVLHPLAGVGAPEQGYYAGLPGKLFAVVNHDANGSSPTFFTEATGILFDTRIPAMAVDTTNYVFTTQPGLGQVTVRARLIYRRSWRALVDAKQWTTDGHGRPLVDVASPYYGHLMEEVQWSSSGSGPVAAYGSGCEGLAAGWQNTPYTGATQFALTLSGAPGAGPALLWLGLSNTSWAGLPLPLDLTGLGAPGCSLLASIDTVYFGTTTVAGAAAIPIAVPHPGPIGLPVYAQWLAPAGNPAGWAVSNALAITVQR